MDGASKFKRQSLLAIERQKKIAKYGIRIAYIVAILMAIAVLVVYTVN